MKYGLSLANFGHLGNVSVMIALARAAEQAGWDGVFVWDHVNWAGQGPHVDPWIALGAIALSTHRLTIGTAVTPLPRRRPWKVAREAMTLDAMSNGRFVFGAGSGVLPSEFDALGEQPDLKVRARMLDEGLDLFARLCSSDEVKVAGEFYRVDTVGFGDPVARPRIPIWLAATWPNRKPLRRAARWDGVLPMNDPYDVELKPVDVEAIAAYVADQRGSERPFEIACAVQTLGKPAAELESLAAEYESAGATWWMDYCHPWIEPLDSLERRIDAGPPGS